MVAYRRRDNIYLDALMRRTEGSYLEPDTVHGLEYLEAIREIFGDRSNAERKAKSLSTRS